MPTISDDEFGTIKLTKSKLASSIRIKVGTDGTLRVSMPPYAPILIVKRFIASSRPQIRKLLDEHQSNSYFVDSMQVGKSHSITSRPSVSSEVAVSRHGQQIIVSLPEGSQIADRAVQDQIRPVVIAALRKEAKSYLPRRLAFLAEEYGFSYQRVRFSHASGRWGSCSTSGTISLNIALMKLPFHLIDYVLVHELSHTKQMNHSNDFWDLVANCDPDYKAHRRELKEHSPSI